MKTKINKNILGSQSMLDTEFLLSTDPEMKEKTITTKRGESFTVEEPTGRIKLPYEAIKKLKESKIKCKKILEKKELNAFLKSSIKARNIIEEIADCHSWMYVSQFEDGMTYYYKFNKQSQELYRHGMVSIGSNSFFMKYSRFPNDKELIDIDSISKKRINKSFRKNFLTEEEEE